jgi:nifR3 family TIM-barrel protein
MNKSPQGFWDNLPKPFFALAPMADVTDAAFRRLIAKYGKPDVMGTEFVAVDGLCSSGRDALLIDFMYSEAERPIVAQIFGSKPDNFFKVAGLLAELGFDGIDINMGCPDRNVNKQGAGSEMIKEPENAVDVINATIEGSKGLPVSVKTRVGYNKVELEDWFPKLLSTNIAALTVHARTRKEMSDVPARWEHVKRAKELASGTGVLIIGNGDVRDLEDGIEKAKETGADGIMIGRAIFGNPWCFNKAIKVEDIPLTERFRVMLEHTRLFEELLGDVKNFAVMKKHYKAYVNGFDGAKELRMQLMEAVDSNEIEVKVSKFLEAN